MALKFRRGTTAQQSGSLAFGEPYVNTTLGTLLIGGPDGDIILSSTGTGSTGNFGAISGSGLDITGDANIHGNLTLGGNITIGDSSTDNVSINADLSSSIIPDVTNAFDLGSTTKVYRNVYATSISGAIAATNGVVSGSSQVIGILDSLNSFSGSQLTQNSALATITGSLIASASTAKTTNDSQGVSLTNLNTFSGSALTRLSALEVETANLESFTSSINTTIKSKLNADGVISGSSQITLSSTTGFSAYSTSVDSRIATEKGRVDAILLSADADKDSFAEIVTLINSVDTENDTAFASFYTASVGRLNNLESTSASVNTSVSNLNTFSGSALTRLATLEIETSNLESFTSSINTTIKTRLNAETVVSGSSQVIGILSSLNTYTGSNDTTNTTQNSRLTALEASASTALSTNNTQGTSITNLNSTTASLNTSVSNLNSFTSSINTTIKTRLNVEGVVSGSSQVNADTITNFDTNVKDKLNADLVVSGSASNVKTFLSLQNVTNESKATMFSSPTFTGTVSGVTATMVGLGNVTNESKATMFTNAALTGTPTAPTAPANTNSTQIATTAYVQQELTDLIGGANEAFDTLIEISASLAAGDSTLNTLVDGKLSKASNLSDLTDTSAARTNLGVAIGTNVQAYNATLAAVAGGTYSGDDSITTIGTVTAGSVTAILPSGTVSGSSQVIGILSSLNTYTGSNNTTNTTQNTRLTALEASASTALSTNNTQGTSITNLNSTTASLNTSVSNLNSFSASALTRLSDLEGKDFTITLTGDVTGVGTVTNLGNVSFATTVAANSVALGTDTTGNYMTNVSAGNAGIVISHTQSEGSTATISLVSGVVSGSSQINVASTTGDIALGTRTSGNYVASLVAGTGITLSNNSGEGATPTIAIGQVVATSSNVQFNSLGVGMAASATAGRIDATNDVVAFSSSDIRFKENIKPIENAIDKIRKISGNTYDWKEENKIEHGYEGNDVGVIAQEIEAVLPQLVQTRESGYKAVKYDKLVALLIEGIKEQQLQIEQLRIDLNNCTNNKGL